MGENILSMSERSHVPLKAVAFSLAEGMMGGNGTRNLQTKLTPFQDYKLHLGNFCFNRYHYHGMKP
jgi:hypothetical protein